MGWRRRRKGIRKETAEASRNTKPVVTRRVGNVLASSKIPGDLSGVARGV